MIKNPNFLICISSKVLKIYVIYDGIHTVHFKTIFRILHCACAEKISDKAEFSSFLSDFTI